VGRVHGFRRSRGRVLVKLDDVERALLADVVAQVLALVEPEDDPYAQQDPLARMVGIDPDAERPDDPALARLLPDAYVDDEESSAEFRRFTQRSLRDLKAERARTVLLGLARDPGREGTEVLPDETAAWLGCLNDARLALGTRLDIGEDDQGRYLELADDDPLAYAYAVYDWLTFLQETLVTAVSGLRSEHPPGVDD
jgi:Domain of unknown function (DUF2017)